MPTIKAIGYITSIIKNIMIISEYQKEKVLTLNKAFKLIKQNEGSSFIWMVVENKHGNRFEIGGRNKSELHVKVYIPNYTEGGEVIKLSVNDRASMNYSIEFQEPNYGAIEFGSAFDRTIEFKDGNDFVNYVNKRNFVNNPIILDWVHLYNEPVYGHKVNNF